MQPAPRIAADDVSERAAAIDPKVPTWGANSRSIAWSWLCWAHVIVFRKRSKMLWHGVRSRSITRPESRPRVPRRRPDMNYTRFGKTGMTVSKLCLGCMTYGSSKWREWVLEEEASRPFIKDALEKGINFFDTADVYSLGTSEEILGRAIRDFAKRDEVVVATKVFNPMGSSPNARGLSRKHIMEAIDASLRRLGMDYVDLYQIHRFDDQTPIEETVEALSDVVRAGKALYVGASSMWTWQFARMISAAREKGLAEFVSMQNFYNLIYREEEREMMKFCADQNLAVIPWSPLARGYLAGSDIGEKASTVR